METRRPVLALVTTLILVAGCGDSGDRLSKQEYLDRIRALEAGDLAREATDVYTEMAAFQLPQSECSAKARTLHSDLDGIVDQVDGLRPPADVQEIQDEFVSAGRKTVDIIGDLAEQIDNDQLQCGQAFNERAYGLPSTSRAQRAIEELGRLGYRIGLNSD